MGDPMVWGIPKMGNPGHGEGVEDVEEGMEEGLEGMVVSIEYDVVSIQTIIRIYIISLFDCRFFITLR